MEAVFADARFDANCSASSLDMMFVAVSFDRRSVLGNNLSALPYDIMSLIIMYFFTTVTPLRVLSLTNCASRALTKVLHAHFTAQAFDVESFLSDFGLVNTITVRVQRCDPSPPIAVFHHHAHTHVTPAAGSSAFKFC